MPTPKTIQEITRKQYNLLVPGQKLFYDSLIADGKVKIVTELTTEEKSADTTTTSSRSNYSNQSQPHLQQPKSLMRRQYTNQQDLLSRLLNCKITILLDNGCIINGILTEITNYELVVDNIIILKHAITTIQLASDSDNSNQ